VEALQVTGGQEGVPERTEEAQEQVEAPCPKTHGTLPIKLGHGHLSSMMSSRGVLQVGPSRPLPRLTPKPGQPPAQAPSLHHYPWERPGSPIFPIRRGTRRRLQADRYAKCSRGRGAEHMPPSHWFEPHSVEPARVGGVAEGRHQTGKDLAVARRMARSRGGAREGRLEAGAVPRRRARLAAWMPTVSTSA
jgi:hypothetical protein